MSASELRGSDGRLHVWVAVLVLVAAFALIFLAATPEPCNDPNTTSCAAVYMGAR